jgi:catechol 2,3-dioxygenase-like lactoylglutathione lyase family enzyme
MTGVARFFHVNICVSDMDRALAFYQGLGLVQVEDVRPRGTDIAPHLGVEISSLRATLLRFPVDGSPLIDLVEYLEPRAQEGPYPTLHNLGACRIAFWTDDFDAVLEHLRSASIPTFGPAVSYPGPDERTLRTVCFEDPDGTGLQFIGEAR